ncbi:hypothetical protein LXL04_026232 [Taraxacum kok-saghyz]
MGDGEGWETVTRRRRHSEEPTWASKMKTAAANRENTPLKDDSIGGKAVSFYITNFPELWKDGEIWKAVREAVGRKFGFARFIGVMDPKACEETLNNIWMKQLRLKANVARFGRNEGKMGEKKRIQAPKIKSVIVQKSTNEECSYVNALTGSPKKECYRD